MIKLIGILREIIEFSDFNLSLKDFLDKYNQEQFPGFTPKNRSLKSHGSINIENIDPSEYDDWDELLSLPREQEKITNIINNIKQTGSYTPVLLSLLNGYRGLILDGHHRVAANIKLGKNNVNYILDLESLIDMWLNKHNKPSTSKIRQEIIDKYII
jgi:hypothetical protein